MTNQLSNLTDIPPIHDNTTRSWVGVNEINDILNLINLLTRFSLPTPPLLTINRAELTPSLGKLLIRFYALSKIYEFFLPLFRIARIFLNEIIFLEIDLKCPLIPNLYIMLS